MKLHLLPTLCLIGLVGCSRGKKPAHDPAKQFAKALSQLEQETARETQRRQRIDAAEDADEGAGAAPPYPPRKQAGQPAVDDR